MSVPLCADRCTLVADLVAQIARRSGGPERAVRVGLGLSPEYVPPIPPRQPQADITHMRAALGILSAPPTPRAVYVCQACGQDYETQYAADECRDFDYQR